MQHVVVHHHLLARRLAGGVNLLENSLTLRATDLNQLGLQVDVDAALSNQLLNGGGVPACAWQVGERMCAPLIGRGSICEQQRPSLSYICGTCSVLRNSQTTLSSMTQSWNHQIDGF